MGVRIDQICRTLLSKNLVPAKKAKTGKYCFSLSFADHKYTSLVYSFDSSTLSLE